MKMHYVEIFVQIHPAISFMKAGLHCIRVRLNDDCLKEFYRNTDLRLVYENDRHHTGSNNSQDPYPTFKTRCMFNNCPRKVQEAILRCLVNSGHRNKELGIIKSYIRKQFAYETFNRYPQDRLFDRLLIKKIRLIEENSTSRESLSEAIILSMVQKSFWGYTKTIRPGETIKAFCDDVVELEIIIEYSGH